MTWMRAVARCIEVLRIKTASTEPGLIVYRFDAPLVFPNAAYFTERLEGLITNAGEGLKCVILDAEPISDFNSTAAEALETLGHRVFRRSVKSNFGLHGQMNLHRTCCR